MRYILTPGRINFAQCWKKYKIPEISDQELKLEKYAAVGKLMVYIQNRSLTKFKQEWFPYIYHIAQQI